MKKLSTGEWIAVVVALLLGVGIFVAGALFRASSYVPSDSSVVEIEQVVPGTEGVADTIVVE